MKSVKGHRYLYRRGDWLYFRRGVPAHLRPAFDGKSEHLVSLQTVDLVRGRLGLARELAKFERIVAAHRMSVAPPSRSIEVAPVVPSSLEIDEQVRAWLLDRRERFYLDFTAGDQADGLALLASLEAQLEDAQRSLGLGATGPSLNVQWLAEEIVERNGWEVSSGSLLERRLHQRLARAQAEVAHEQITELKGRPHSPLDATFSAEQFRLDEERRRDRRGSGAPVSLGGLYDAYVAQRKPSPATQKSWKRVVPSLVAFLKHDDASRITPDDIVAWKNHLTLTPGKGGQPISPQTVKETYLAAIKVVFRWAVEELKVGSDPTEKVGMRVPKTIRNRISKGFRDEEALTILRGTLETPSNRIGEQRRLARRWVPWLCAYTGARVNEMTQLRAEDVRQEGGIWAVFITPEAGSVKNGHARLVPIHSHLIEQGFLQAVGGKTGPLFHDPELHKGGSKGNPHYKKTGERLAAWVRGLGVDDPGVAPNHGWRHRFKTQGRRVRMQEDVRDAIQGHVPRTEGEDYGDKPLDVMQREIELLPRYEVEGLPERGSLD